MSWDNEDKELQESADALREKRKMHQDVIKELAQIWSEIDNTNFSGFQRDIEDNCTEMKQVNIDQCETANDAYLAMKREKEPCFGRFNRVWVYANVENPPHEN